MFYSYKEYIPVVHPDAFVHPMAVVRGNVRIGRDVYVGPGAVLRGDWGGIVIEEGANVQENVVIHMFPGVTVIVERHAHIGHCAVIHGAHIGQNALIGMNAVILDNAFVGAESIVGALTLVKSGMHIPERSLVIGNPGKIVKKVTDEMIQWKSEGTALYRQLPSEMKKYWHPCQPLLQTPDHLPPQEPLYRTWQETRSESNPEQDDR